MTMTSLLHSDLKKKLNSLEIGLMHFYEKKVRFSNAFGHFLKSKNVAYPLYVLKTTLNAPGRIILSFRLKLLFSSGWTPIHPGNTREIVKRTGKNL